MRLYRIRASRDNSRYLSTVGHAVTLTAAKKLARKQPKAERWMIMEVHVPSRLTVTEWARVLDADTLAIHDVDTAISDLALPGDTVATSRNYKDVSA